MTFKPQSLSSSYNFLIDKDICPLERVKAHSSSFFHKILEDLIPNDCWFVVGFLVVVLFFFSLLFPTIFLKELIFTLGKKR